MTAPAKIPLCKQWRVTRHFDGSMTRVVCNGLAIGFDADQKLLCERCAAALLLGRLGLETSSELIRKGKL